MMYRICLLLALCVLRCHAQRKEMRDCYLNTNAPSSFVYEVDYEGDKCFNEDVLEGYAVCDGKCISSSRFKDDSDNLTGYCKCCLPSGTKRIEITLFCPQKNIRIQKKVLVPTACACTSKCTQNRMPSPVLPEAL